MRKALLVVLGIAAAVMLVGVVVFRLSLNLSLLDSIYFVITTMTTVGYGDINLFEAGPATKVIGMCVMVAGAATVAAGFGLMTDYILSLHFDRFLGAKVKRMKNHVIVTGLGKVGIRVVGKLHRLGEQVVIVDRDQEGRFVAEAKSMKVPMVFGDIRSAETLKQANVEAAASIVACTNDDLINLESALTARELNADIRVVLRVFDPGLAKRIQAGFGLDTAFSTSALAAPAFALAAVDPSVIGSVLLEDQLMLNVEVEVAAHSRLDGMSTAELRELGDLSILIHRSAKSGQRKLHPSGTFALAAGDTLVLCVTPEFRVPLKQLNQI